MKKELTPLEKLHEDYRKNNKENNKEEDEIVRIHTRGGSAET